MTDAELGKYVKRRMAVLQRRKDEMLSSDKDFTKPTLEKLHGLAGEFILDIAVACGYEKK